MPVLDVKGEYLGHMISSNGLKSSPSKVTTIVNAPAPRDVYGLQSQLGLMLVCYASNLDLGPCFHTDLVMEQRKQSRLRLGLWLQLRGSTHSLIRKRWP